MAAHFHLVLDLDTGEITHLALPKDVAGGASGDSRIRETLAGSKDGINTTYGPTSQKFTRVPGKEERVLYNGAVQEFGVGNDYTVSESGGVGTGYDTINFSVALKSWEKLEIIYIPV